MFLDINKIESEGVAFDRSLSLASLEGLAGETIEICSTRIQGEARPGQRGIDFEARLAARLKLTCFRCLETFESDIEGDVSLVLVRDAVELPAGEHAANPEDAALFYAKEGKASLEEIATEQIYLALPLKPICREGCKGLCPTCGTNRNREPCSCTTESVDPRLAPLLKFKDHGHKA